MSCIAFPALVKGSTCQCLQFQQQQQPLVLNCAAFVVCLTVVVCPIVELIPSLAMALSHRCMTAVSLHLHSASHSSI